MSIAVATSHPRLHTVATTSLSAAAHFWFVVTVAGQLVLGFTIAAFYGLTALRGDYHRWGHFISHGVIPGDRVGNLAIALHVGGAVLMILAGALQLVPAVRRRFPAYHRWSGRVYLLAALVLSAAGVYMIWGRHAAGGVTEHVGSTLNAVLVWVCAAMALRHAVRRELAAHRRWALRLFLVVSGAFFFRAAFFLAVIVLQGRVDVFTVLGPPLSYLSFLLPLALLEVYLRVQRGSTTWLPRLATAMLLFALTLGMGAGLVAIGMAAWVPQVRAAFDTRPSVAAAVSATLAERGVDAAVRQYRALRASAAAHYNFDEPELNALGYELLRSQRLREAVRIFQLNVEAYPRSSNVYDSLAEAYATLGDAGRAVAAYRRALQIDPRNSSSAAALRRLLGQ